MLADISVHEPKPPQDPILLPSPWRDTRENRPRLDLALLVAGWNSVQSLNKFQQEIGGR